MAKRVQLIRHVTGSADAFTGNTGELTVDTTKKEVRVHDGLTAGGIPQARADLNNVNAATNSVAGKMSAADKVAHDANVAKLAGIEAGATADQTAAEIRTLVDAATDSNVLTDALKAILDNIFRVGHVLITTNATNPGTSGYPGTWERIAKGRTIIGEGTGVGLTARTAGDELGVEDAVVVAHDHTADAVAAHAHSMQNHTHSGTTSGNGSHLHTVNYSTDTGGSNTARRGGALDGTFNTGSESTHTHTITTGGPSTPNTGGGGAHTPTIQSEGVSGTDKNMQPSLVCYIWERTA